jgi:hypothetical protein
MPRSQEGARVSPPCPGPHSRRLGQLAYLTDTQRLSINGLGVECRLPSDHPRPSDDPSNRSTFSAPHRRRDLSRASGTRSGPSSERNSGESALRGSRGLSSFPGIPLGANSSRAFCWNPRSEALAACRAPPEFLSARIPPGLSA